MQVDGGHGPALNKQGIVASFHKGGETHGISLAHRSIVNCR